LTAAQLGRACHPNLTFFHEVDKGGHFAAWKEPELFSAELRGRLQLNSVESRPLEHGFDDPHHRSQRLLVRQPHRGGGHNLPQQASAAFAQAVIDVAQ
jgi:hypothetical protein